MKIFIAFNFFLVAACSSAVDEHLKYLGQEPPGTKPQIFAPGVISLENQFEFGSVFNADGSEFYYAVDIEGISQMRYSKLLNGLWTPPETILSHEKYGFNDPFLSPDEKRLYFISKRSQEGLDAKRDHDIWYVEKENGNWSKPINAGPNINSAESEYYISFTQSGTMYFASNINAPEDKWYDFDIYYSEWKDGGFQKPVRLSDSINTSNYEADVFVDPNESYLIFSAQRRGGHGRGDLYISFKNPVGSWSKSRNMGSLINTEHMEFCPFVTRDGKYFFYSSNEDIYWVSAKIIDSLRAGK